MLEGEPSGGHDYESLRWAGGTVAGHKESLHCGCTAEWKEGRREQDLAVVLVAWLGRGRSEPPALQQSLEKQPSQLGPLPSPSSWSIIQCIHWLTDPFCKLCTLISSRYWGEYKLLIHLIYIFCSWIRSLNTKWVRFLWNNLVNSEPRE